jgi:hypothetical protein
MAMAQGAVLMAPLPVQHLDKGRSHEGSASTPNRLGAAQEEDLTGGFALAEENRPSGSVAHGKRRKEESGAAIARWGVRAGGNGTGGWPP